MRARASADADATRVQGEATAEAIQKRADAEKSLSDASLQVQMIEILPEVVKAAASALGNTKMNIVSTDGKSTGVSGVLSEIIGVANSLDLKELMSSVGSSNNSESSDVDSK